MNARSGSRLILASASPRRQEILSSAGIEFEIFPTEVDESVAGRESPEKHVLRLARMKAVEGTKRKEEQWVLAADTIVVIDGKILGKPRDLRDAAKMLRLLSGRDHRVITGYCILRGSSRKSREGAVVTRVRFKALSPEEIRWYLDTGEPFDKAGAYAIQGKAAFMIKEIHGSYTNVVGLPLTEVVEALIELGAADLFNFH
jgi:septum formation protein